MNMKLILTADVDNLGVAGDIVEVKPGYGRNFLLPRGYAIVATRGAEKQVEGIKRAAEERAIRDADHAKEIKTQLDALENIEIPVKTSEKGKIFGSVDAQTVADAIKKSNRLNIDKRSISLTKGHIKSTGKYTAEVKLAPGVVAHVKFKVVAQ